MEYVWLRSLIRRKMSSKASLDIFLWMQDLCPDKFLWIKIFGWTNSYRSEPLSGHFLMDGGSLYVTTELSGLVENYFQTGHRHFKLAVQLQNVSETNISTKLFQCKQRSTIS